MITNRFKIAAVAIRQGFRLEVHGGNGYVHYVVGELLPRVLHFNLVV